MNKILEKVKRCSHEVIINEMCAVCGEDLRSRNDMSNKKKTSITKTTTIAASSSSSSSSISSSSNYNNNNNNNKASVRIIHAEPRIRVSEKEAHEIGKKDLMNLVKNKKLVLLVDLDHTLIHTTNENVRADLKEVHHYELMHKNIWYHTKFRPNCNKFLQEISKLFELHMVTFGERNYAHTIAKLMDPDQHYFHDRILSRNEIFNPISKTDNLKDLFPRGDLMVCIIDDREDVWNYAHNLICVKPYVFFKNTGDINDPTQQQQQQQTKSVGAASAATSTSVASKSSSISKKNEKKSKLKTNELDIDNNSVDSSSSSSSSSSSNSSENSNSSNKSNKSNEKKSKFENNDDNYDPDDYLSYLENILLRIHDEYYRIYEQRLKSKSNSSKLNKSDELQIDESDLPDLKKVLPLIKSKVLENVVITFSGVVPTGYDLCKQRCYLMATSLGAKVNEHLILPDSTELLNQEDDDEELNKTYEYSYDDDETSSSSNCSGGAKRKPSLNEKLTKKHRYTTHLVAAKHGTSKVHDASKCSKHKIHVVTPEWLIESNYKWIKCKEKAYKLTKDYDYKHCIFHNEYKFSAAVAANNSGSISTSVTSKRNINNLQANSSQLTKLDDESQTKKSKHEINSAKYEISQDFFNKMDQEVDKELFEENEDDDDDDDDDEEEDDNDEEEEDDEEENPKNNNNINNNNYETSTDDDATSLDDIDDDMVSALEKDFN